MIVTNEQQKLLEQGMGNKKVGETLVELLENASTSSGSGDISNGGNSTGAAIVIGTLDANPLTLIANDIPKLNLTVDTASTLQVPQSTTNSLDFNLAGASGIPGTEQPGGYIALTSGDADPDSSSAVGGNIYLSTGVNAQDGTGLSDGQIIFRSGRNNTVGQFTGVGTFSLPGGYQPNNVPLFDIAGIHSIYTLSGNTHGAVPPNTPARTSTTVFTYTTVTQASVIFEIRIAAVGNHSHGGAGVLKYMVKNDGGTVTCTSISSDVFYSDLGTWTVVPTVFGSDVQVIVTGTDNGSGFGTTVQWQGVVIIG